MVANKLQDPILNSGRVQDTDDKNYRSGSASMTTIAENEELLRMLADTAPMMVWMAGCDTLCNYFNSVWLEFTGRSHPQEIGNGWLEGVHPQDQQQVYDDFLTALEKRQKFNRQYRLRRFDGEYRWILDTATPRLTADGNLLGYIGYAVDMTEVKDKNYTNHPKNQQTEQSLLLRQQKLQEFLKSSPGVIYSCEASGDRAITFISENVTAVLGYEVSECLNNSQFWIDRVNCDDKPQILSGFSSLFEHRHQIHEYRFLHKNGDWRWIRDEQKLITDDKGNAIEIVGCCLDITERKQVEFDLELAKQKLEIRVEERTKKLKSTVTSFRNLTAKLKKEIAQCKQTEEALQTSYSLLDSVINSTPDIIFVKDLQGRYVMVNSSFAHFVNKSTEEIIGKDDAVFFAPETVYQVRAIDQAVITTGVAETLEEVVLQNGQYYTYLSTKSPWRDTQGNIIGVIGITRDISDRKRAEQSLQALVAGTASVTGEEFFPVLVRHLAGALGVRYASVATRMEDNPDKIVSLAYWDTDKLKENYEYELAQTPCEIIYNDGMHCFASNLQQLFPQNQNVVAMELESYLGAPLLDTFGKAVGHLCVFDTKPILQEEHAQAILKIFAARATAELQRQRTEYALRQSEKQFRELASKEALLNRIASQIRASLDINTILETAVTEIRNLLLVHVCVFTWYVADAQPPYWENVQEARNPTIPSLLNLRATTEEIGLIAKKVFDKEIIRVDDVQGICDPISRQFFIDLGLTAILVLPIHTQSGEIGALGCHHYTGSRYWQDSEVELLLAVADQIAIAIDQAELYKQSHIAAQTAQEKAQQLEEALRELQATQTQLIQTEKMSSLGQLVAGVAHEINNPVNFIHGNINYATEYTHDLLHLVKLYQQYYPDPVAEVQEEIEAIDLEFINQDLPQLLTSMKIGTDRIRQIVLSLRNFSRLDEAEMKEVDIHEGINNTLLLLQNRLKAKPEHSQIPIVKEYGNLPLVECYVGQLNQVFMNLLANAIDALEESIVKNPGLLNKPQIRIRTEIQENSVLIRITDNGPGMTEEVRQKLFDPFFTTKPVGKGTGMGLSISYKIIVEKHNGRLQCISAPGQGAEFVVAIPLKQPVS